MPNVKAPKSKQGGAARGAGGGEARQRERGCTTAVSDDKTLLGEEVLQITEHRGAVCYRTHIESVGRDKYGLHTVVLLLNQLLGRTKHTYLTTFCFLISREGTLRAHHELQKSSGKAVLNNVFQYGYDADADPFAICREPVH